VRRIFLSALGGFVLFAAGCGHGKPSAGGNSASEKGGGLKINFSKLGDDLDRKTPKEIAEIFRSKITADTASKKLYAVSAQKYVNSPDPDVQAAAKELIEAAQ
jgi:hypothetical protein